MIFRNLMLSLLIAAAAGCASSGKRERGGRAAGPVGVNQPSALLSHARDLQARQGCARAAPAYRIVSSFGDGYEIAQYELGACLLEMVGDSDEETALFRNESLFWLNRAAWAGNPRAQLKLAEILSGAPGQKISFIDSDPVRAEAWSIIYDKNGARETYGLRPLGSLVSAHLQSALAPEMTEAARMQAAQFHKISMTEFAPMASDEARAGSENRGSGPERSGERRRRPR